MNTISLVSSKEFVVDAYGFEGFAMVLMILIVIGLGFMFIRKKKANNRKK